MHKNIGRKRFVTQSHFAEKFVTGCDVVLSSCKASFATSLSDKNIILISILDISYYNQTNMQIQI